MDELQRLNHDLFFAINNGLKSPLGDALLGYSTYIGDGAAIYPLATIGLWLLDRKKFWTNFGLVALAAILGGAVLHLLKHHFNAPRPLAFFDEAIQRGEAVVNVMFEPLRARSFPSGHAQTAFSFAHVFAFLVSRSSLSQTHQRLLRFALYAIATLVAISRVYVGAHFPIDVVAGAFIGVFVSQLVIWTVQLLERAKSKPSTSDECSTESKVST
ncbi:MAG: phosphatase PAP2 family protein [Chloroherpetonaceae bacterium]|nr:phosphatase PAP2 family protein [Chloroherpetonaceae bacterium]MDW8437949.1 phosphatase PAP2 family protein [Chloroherpetonaceae bacterium]